MRLGGRLEAPAGAVWPGSTWPVVAALRASPAMRAAQVGWRAERKSAPQPTVQHRCRPWCIAARAALPRRLLGHAPLGVLPSAQRCLLNAGYADHRSRVERGGLIIGRLEASAAVARPAAHSPDASIHRQRQSVRLHASSAMPGAARSGCCTMEMAQPQGMTTVRVCVCKSSQCDSGTRSPVCPGRTCASAC